MKGTQALPLLKKFTPLKCVFGRKEFTLDFPHICLWEEKVYPPTYRGRTKNTPTLPTCGENLPVQAVFCCAWEEKHFLDSHTEKNMGTGVCYM